MGNKASAPSPFPASIYFLKKIKNENDGMGNKASAPLTFFPYPFIFFEKN